MEDGKVMSKLEILYEDNHIIVVKKPCNILSQSDSTKDLDLLTMVKMYIKEKYNKPGNVYIGLVHRLDRPVSGVMVFARTSKAARRLSEDIRNNKFKKEYVAVVKGVGLVNEDRFVDYLEKGRDGNTVISKKGKGKLSILEYKVLKVNYDKEETLVKINLITGRHHQIRVQFASRKYPLCGDMRYSNNNKGQIALCCISISFLHPITKEEVLFKIDFPSGRYWNDF